MRHQNSVFHGLTKHVPWTKLEQIVEKYGADKLVRKLTTKRQLIALLYGQFSGATSLRAIVSGMESHETRLYHLGAAAVKRSTMSDANTVRPWQRVVCTDVAAGPSRAATDEQGCGSAG
jgi:hypothetical protein